MREQRESLFAALTVCAMGTLCATTVAHADLIHITSSTLAPAQLGAFIGTLDYSFDTLTQSGELEISLLNTTPSDFGDGFITGLAFNINSADPDAAATLSFTSFPLFLDTGPEHAPPLGPFDAGAALGGNWTGGGDPHDGIGIGQTGIFRFDIVASDAASLTAMSFITGPAEHNFALRFRGFHGGGSSKVPAVVVPSSGSVSLLAVALLLVSTRRRSAELRSWRSRLLRVQ